MNITEIIKCANDEKYFINEYIKVSHPVKGVIPMVLNTIQTSFVDKMHDKTFIIDECTDRQIGSSTLWAVHALWTCLFTPDATFILVAPKRIDVANLTQIFDTAVDNLPDFLADELNISTKFERLFNSNSSVYFRDSFCRYPIEEWKLTTVILDSVDRFGPVERKYLLSLGNKHELSPLVV